ncbi:MAG TPA: hypothetical protein P5571_10860 [Candidatus Krumholzibacteria bacterium]|nr:hypothetical protein [Candidatus Krumholzibacteria bacterium]HRX51855.1 hypothetical protein [Candidatus Krumholzibacteria bacterium]
MSWIARFGGAVPLVISVVMLAVGAASAGDVVPIVWNGCEIPHQSGTWKVVDRAASALGEDGTVAVIAVLARGDISDRRNWKTGLLRWSAGTLEILEVEGEGILAGKGRSLDRGSVFVDRDGAVVFHATGDANSTGWYRRQGAERSALGPGIDVPAADLVRWSLIARDATGRSAWFGGSDPRLVIESGGRGHVVLSLGARAPGFRGEIRIEELHTVDLGPNPYALIMAAVSGVGVPRPAFASWRYDGESMDLLTGPGILDRGSACPDIEPATAKLQTLMRPAVLADGSVWMSSTVTASQGLPSDRITLVWRDGIWSNLGSPWFVLEGGTWSQRTEREMAGASQTETMNWQAMIQFGIGFEMAPLLGGDVIANLTTGLQREIEFNVLRRIPHPIMFSLSRLDAVGRYAGGVFQPPDGRGSLWGIHESGAALWYVPRQPLPSFLVRDGAGRVEAVEIPQRLPMPDGTTRSINGVMGQECQAQLLDFFQRGALTAPARWPRSGAIANGAGAFFIGLMFEPEPGFYDGGFMLCLTRLDEK